VKKKNIKVGDLVKCSKGGEHSKKGIIWRVEYVYEKELPRYAMRPGKPPPKLYTYKLKPVWGLFDSHKGKQKCIVDSSYVESLGIVDLGRQCLELQNVAREWVKERSGAEEEETVP
jgi:hypothetical protein